MAGVIRHPLGVLTLAGCIDLGEGEELTTAECSAARAGSREHLCCGWSATCSNDCWPSGQGDIDTVNRYCCVDDPKAGFPVAPVCVAAGAPTSDYSSRAAKAAWWPSQQEQDEQALIAETRGFCRPAGRRGRPVNRKRVEGHKNVCWNTEGRDAHARWSSLDRPTATERRISTRPYGFDRMETAL